MTVDRRSLVLVAACVAAVALVAPARAQCPKGTKRQQATVRKGETLPALAKRLDVASADLKRWNRLRDAPPRAGRAVTYCAPLAASVGTPGHGRLIGGVSFDPKGERRGKGWVMNPGRTRLYGTRQTVDAVKGCLAQYRATYRDLRKAPPVNVGDLSERAGGAAPPHVSHESGRDIDLGYVTRPPQSPGLFDREATPQNLDVEKQWFLVRCFLDHRATQAMFIEWSVVKALRAHVEKRPALKRKYLRFFPAAQPNVIKADSDHRTHMHVRFHCPKGDRKCVD